MLYERARGNLRRGETASASRETEKGLRRYASAQSEWHWRFRVLKADIQHRQGLDAESLALLKEDPPPSLAVTDVPVRRKLAQSVASAFTQHLEEARQFVAEAEALAKAQHPELLGEVALRNGTIAFLAGDSTGADAAYREALQLARMQKDAFLEAGALSGLGVTATKQERYDESIEWNKKALELSRAIGAQYSFAQTLGNMGWGYMELGDFDNALSYYQQAEQASLRAGLSADRAYWLTSIAYVYNALRDFRAAETTLKQALELARNHDDKGTLVQCLNQLTEIAIETGDVAAAEKYSQEVLSSEHSGLEQRLIVDGVFFRGRLAEEKHDYAAAESAFKQVLGEPGALTSQKWQAQARLADVYAARGEARPAEAYFRRSLSAIDGVRSSIHAEDLRLSFLSSAIDFYHDYINFLAAQNRLAEALQVAELSRARTLAEGLGSARAGMGLPLTNFQPEEIARHQRAVLLFYSVGERSSRVWAITRTGTFSRVLPGEEQLAPMVKAYREAILGGRDVLAAGDANGSKLYDLLVAPVQKLIPPGSRVIVLPDENLYTLNFETLIVPSPKPHFWIEDVTVSSASSLTLLANGKRSSSRQNGSLLLVGNPLQATPDFPILRQAPTEMAQIERYFPGPRRQVLTGPGATPAAFLNSKAENFAYVHFVTHGIASRSHPLDSAVILSPDGDSYKLYARDIVKRPLSAQVVTISACNGSGLRAYSGEGLIGLSWAFLRAGAHNVISALWEVNDVSTTQLMDQLYGHLSRRDDPASALRSAKLTLLRSDGVFRKPFYWAAFQLYSRN